MNKGKISINKKIAIKILDFLDRKLDFDIWYNPKNNLILKVSYSKMGDWEYRLNNFE